MTEPVAPIDWARHYAAQREQQPEPTCSMPGFIACACDHITGCQYPGPPDPQPVPPGFHEQLRATKAVEPAEPPNLDEQQPARHTVDTITSDALDALYEMLDAAQETELARQLDTCDKAFASATLRAARAGAAIARVQSVLDRLDEFADATISVPDRALYRAIATDLRAALDPQESTP